MKVIKTVKPEFLIDCGLCWYEVHKYSGYGVLSKLAVLVDEAFSVWYLVFSQKKLQFSREDCNL